jgi:hypothetical protein
MFATLVLLLAGCTLRVSMEPLAYEGILPFAWKLLPLSGCLELGAVLLFALQLILTFAREPSIFPQVAPIPAWQRSCPESIVRRRPGYIVLRCVCHS